MCYFGCMFKVLNDVKDDFFIFWFLLLYLKEERFFEIIRVFLIFKMYFYIFYELIIKSLRCLW